MTMEFGFEYVFGRVEGSESYGPKPRLLPAEFTDNDEVYEMFDQVHTFYQEVLGRDGGNGQGGTGNGVSYPVTRSLGQTYLNYVSDATCPGTYFSEGLLYFCQGQIAPDICS